QAAGTNSGIPAGGGGAKPGAAPTQKSAASATPGAPAPAGGAPAAPGGKANYASDVGVSADTIRIGTITMTSATRSLGPALAGVQEQNLDAAVKYINRSGGDPGRPAQPVTGTAGAALSRGRACSWKVTRN